MTLMNRTSSFGLLHCHYCACTYPFLCCSLPHTDMSTFHSHDSIFVRRLDTLGSNLGMHPFSIACIARKTNGKSRFG